MDDNNRDPQDQLLDETLRALGWYVLRFSGLTYALHTASAELQGLGWGQNRMLAEYLKLAAQMATRLVDIFFASFRSKWEGQITAADEQILTCLRDEMKLVVKERNRLMHDVWNNGPRGLPLLPLTRHRAVVIDGNEYHEEISYTPARLNSLCSDLDRLRTVVETSVWTRQQGQIGTGLEQKFHIVGGVVAAR